MTNVKLTDGTAILCDTVEIQNGILVLETNTNKTAEELRELFSDRVKLGVITLQTESGKILGSKYGFVCYAGITLLENGSKRIELIQEKDITEQRITGAEIRSTQAMEQSYTAGKTAIQAKEQAQTVDGKIDTMQANVDQAILELTIALTATSISQEPVQEGGTTHV